MPKPRKPRKNPNKIGGRYVSIPKIRKRRSKIKR